jgi:type IV pilus assembly protein PilM
MTNTPGVWGIDLGQCGLKAVRLQEIDGQLSATAFDYVEHPKILSQPDADADELIREALQKFLERNTVRGDLVAISVPGQSGLARFVKLPPVEEKKIQDIVRFEAKQQIPFNLDEVVWDYQKIGSGVVTDGFAMETEIGLFAMKRDMVNRYLQHFKDVGVEVHVVQMAPLALCNFVSYDLLGKTPTSEPVEADKRRCIVALDIGADSSNLVITDGERVIWQRPIPLGGNHFTRALTKDLKLTFAKAEHLKRNAMKSPDLKQILSSLKPVLNDFVGEVQRSLGYFTNTHRDAQIEYMVGLGNAFRLPGLQRFLSEKLQLEVRKLTKMEHLTGDTVVTSPIFGENILSFAVAYGLALQGLKQARLLTNLLPAEIRTERLVRAKKPWAVTAAAVLLLSLGFTGIGIGLTNRTYGSKAVLDAEAQSEETKKRADAAENAFKKSQADAKREEEGVRSIIAGQDERVNWLELLAFVGNSVPQPNGKLPDGTPLPDEMLKEYWTKGPSQPRQKAAGIERGKPGWAAEPMTGQQAFERWQDRIRSGITTASLSTPTDAKDPKPVGDDLGPGIDDLIQLNIEVLDARYCDDLGAFWKNVQDKIDKDKKDLVRPLEQYDKAPDGKGWVIELHGYTFHHGGDVFVANTLMESLATRGDALSALAGNAASGDKAAPAAAPPAVQPAKPETEDKKTEEKKPEEKGVVKKRVSHVVLYSHAFQKVSDNSNFALIHKPLADSLIVAAPSADSGKEGVPAGPGMPPGPGGGTGAPGGTGVPAVGGGMPSGPGAADSGGAASAPSRSGWAPLGTLGSSGGAGMGPPGLAPGMPPRGVIPGGPPFKKGGKGLDDRGPGPGMPPKDGLSTAKDQGQGPHQRTEFVILFIWREPTPSDALREGDSSTTSSTTTTSSAPATTGTPGAGK